LFHDFSTHPLESGKLIGILKVITLFPPQLPLLLVHDVLGEFLFAKVALELADEPGIPEGGGDAKVLAGAHKGVGFAALSGSGYAVWFEVLLFTAGDGDKAVLGLTRFS
jgi:hypothetical protein